ncbi:hypothetical protein M0R36_06160 [bacterium]|jgi:type II secretory pathway component PulC|nr:hypothetical protein [bacterium]
MAKRRPTPEEQLLDLIEKGDDLSSGKIRKRRLSPFGFSGIKGFIYVSRIKSRAFFSGILKSVKEPNLKLINNLLLVLICIVFGFSLFDFLVRSPGIEEFFRNIHTGAFDKPVAGEEKQGRPFLHYLEIVRRRNIFSPLEIKRFQKEEKTVVNVQDMVSDLALVGISWDKDDPVAMIEDKKNQRTYFLKKGDTFSDFRVEEIFSDRVIIKSGANKIEMK